MQLSNCRPQPYFDRFNVSHDAHARRSPIEAYREFRVIAVYLKLLGEKIHGFSGRREIFRVIYARAPIDVIIFRCVESWKPPIELRLHFVYCPQFSGPEIGLNWRWWCSNEHKVKEFFVQLTNQISRLEFLQYNHAKIRKLLISASSCSQNRHNRLWQHEHLFELTQYWVVIRNILNGCTPNTSIVESFTDNV